MKSQAIDYRGFRLSKLHQPVYQHLKLLLYWPVYGLAFQFVEHCWPVEQYIDMHCTLDDWIPFHEAFLIPYLFWFAYLILMHVYTLMYDVDTFRRMMKFIMLTYTITIAIYLIFPTSQSLRPTEFPRDNVLTRLTAGLYAFDTNTNVCPSIHVLGSAAVMLAAAHTPELRRGPWAWAVQLTGVLICASTVFMKQHSVLDVLAAVPLCLLGYWAAFSKSKKKE